MKSNAAPKFYIKVLNWFCRKDYLEELQGDLEEAFEQNSREFGPKKARQIYKSEVIRLFRPSVFRQFSISHTRKNLMLKNYVITSLRAMKHNPFYITANILGMALALTICTIGYFNFRYNSSFNQYFDQAQNIYKIHGLRTGESTVGPSPLALAPSLRSSGIQAARYHHERITLKKNNQLMLENVSFVDEPFLGFFNIENLNGGTIRKLEPNEVFISDQTADKLFGEKYPVGKMVRFVLPNKEEQSFIVKDIFRKPPNNTSFQLSIILSFDNYLKLYGINKNDWSQWIDGTFVSKEKTSSTGIEKQLEQFLALQNDENPQLKITQYKLDNILDWPAFENQLYKSEFNRYMHPAAVMGTAGSAIAILLLACFNFINTSIALSGNRLKEIGIRKVLGGNRKSTITQFMIENMMTISVAALLSIVISYFLIPAYNAMMTIDVIQMDIIPYSTIAFFGIGLVVIVSLIAGAYPSFYISKFSSLKIFRNKVVLSGRNSLMIVLLTFQFALCFYNIFGLLLLVDNSIYQNTLDRGYEINRIINVPLSDPGKYSELEDRLSQNPDILSISGTSNLIGFDYTNESLNYNGTEHQVAELNVGKGYLETLGVRLELGSFLSDNNIYDGGVVINRMLQDRIGTDLLNKSLIYKGERLKIIGIVKDFNLYPIMFDNEIQPCIIRMTNKENYKYISLLVDGIPLNIENDIEAIWYELFPQELYTGFLQEEVMYDVRLTNSIMIKITVTVSIISILISILGLYTLISLIVQKRSKEFGIRKVLGASSQVVARLLGKDLYWIIGISSIIGLSTGAYVMSVVFDIIYAYHIELGISHFVWPLILIIGIIVTAIGYKVFKTGRLNPTEQLRME